MKQILKYDIKTEYSKYLYATSTIPNNRIVQSAWHIISDLNNRFIQRFRRYFIQNGLVDSIHDIQYVRVIEKHLSGYPHAHWIFQFSNNVIPFQRTSNRYYRHKILLDYKKLRDTWNNGFTDFQVPFDKLHRDRYLKYITKNISHNSILVKRYNQQLNHNIIKPNTNPMKLHGVLLAYVSNGFDFKDYVR